MNRQEAKDDTKEKSNRWLTKIKYLLKEIAPDNLPIHKLKRRAHSESHIDKILVEPKLVTDQRGSHPNLQKLDVSGFSISNNIHMPHFKYDKSLVLLDSHKYVDKHLKIASRPGTSLMQRMQYTSENDKISFKMKSTGIPDASFHGTNMSDISAGAEIFRNVNQFVETNEDYFGRKSDIPILETVDLIPEIYNNIISSDKTSEIKQDTKSDKTLFKKKEPTSLVTKLKISNRLHFSQETVDKSARAQLSSKIGNNLHDGDKPATLKLEPDKIRRDLTDFKKEYVSKQEATRIVKSAIKFVNSHSEEDIYGIKMVPKADFDFSFPKTYETSKSKPKLILSSSELIKETQNMLLARAKEQKKKLEEERQRRQNEHEKRKITLDEKNKRKEEKIKMREEVEKQVTEETRRLEEEKTKMEWKILEEDRKKQKAGKIIAVKNEIKLKKSAAVPGKTSSSQQRVTDEKSTPFKPKNGLKIDKETENKNGKGDYFRKEKGNEQLKTDKVISKEHKVKEKEIGKYTEKKMTEMVEETKQKVITKSEEDTQKDKVKLLKEKDDKLKGKEEKPKQNENKNKSIQEKEKTKVKGEKSKDKYESKEKDVKLKKIQTEKEDKSTPNEKKIKENADKLVDQGNKLLNEQNKQRENEMKAKKQQEEDEKKAKEAAENKAIQNEILAMKRNKEAKSDKKPEPVKEQPKTSKKEVEPIHKELRISDIKVRRSSPDDLILQLVRLKQTDPKKLKEKALGLNKAEAIEMMKEHHLHHGNALRLTCLMCISSDLAMDIEEKFRHDIPQPIEDIIVGQKIFKYKPPYIPKKDEKTIIPILFESVFTDEVTDENVNYISEIPQTILSDPIKEVKYVSTIEQEPAKGIIRYALSDRTFIDKGWTMLPTEKVVRKMNVYRMRPVHPEFDWFEHNKNKKLMMYETGEKLAEFDETGRGRWYYQNGNLALDYYDAEEMNAQQRFVIYSSGEPDERGRTHPITILAAFDYLGNGVVFDHGGKIRLKYNQTEGVVLDRGIGPVSHWKWHTLNDPPVLQQVMIDTQMAHKDPEIIKLGGAGDDKPRPDNEEMLAIEFDNFIKEKGKKLSQTFKPFQIRMKALKINEHFSLKVLDQATVYLIFRDGSTNLKLNIGMILDHKEIVDTDTADVGDVSNSLERFPARTESLARLQRSVAYAQRFERARTERERRLRPPEPCNSADELTAAVAKPLRPPFCTVPSGSSTRKDSYCKCNRKPSVSNLYYDTRFV
ncbi:hypothetical protein K1T71_001997 [Dendrolimus kikuchii]|uniref:Uncharacterized protein n=1 Tax=Dendrolimus kikuchii TaxID=765133 RepID=A0ACC1DF95_9NEOP|nr:hypothetical protein K1T71_001997 [Dendrolimus kikuchii]